MSNNYILDDFEKAIENLKEVLGIEKNDIVRDSAIKRFELCYDLAWKSIKNHAKKQGMECYSPRECFKSAFQLKLIDNDKNWLDMIENRNLSAHLYDEKSADKIFARLPDYLNSFKDLLLNLKK